MPASFSALFDTLLVLAGLVLLIAGLVMFIRSKTSSQPSSVEAFGIKLNVTHPSLILVLAGVGLMLAPRLLPEPAGKGEPVVVADEAGTPPSAASPGPEAAPALSPAPNPPVPAVAGPPAGPPSKPAVALPAATPSAASARPAPTVKAPAAAPPASSRPVTQTASARPVAKPAATAAPPVAASAVTSAPRPAPAVPPARAMLAYAALAQPTNRSFWNNETRASYTRRMQASLQQAGR